MPGNNYMFPWMDETTILTRFLDMLKDAPSSIILIAFAMWMFKKQIINSNLEAFRMFMKQKIELEEKRIESERRSIKYLQNICREIGAMHESVKKHNEAIDIIGMAIDRRNSMAIDRRNSHTKPP